ncbi:unnamed protein product [Closterium sp. NIES-64]|nr:unnamed protein product [Closterium sp. NIES-64]
MLPRRAGSSRGSPHRRTASEADRPAPIAETSLRIWRVLLLAGNRNAATRATVCDCAAECAATPVTLIAAVAAAAATMMRAAVTALLSNGWADKRYEDVQNAALTLLYLQAFIGLLGTVGPTYTGVIVADVGVALFGLVAVASGYQALGRTYAALLMLMLLLDSLWLALFAPHIWSEELTAPWRQHPLVALAVLLELTCHSLTFTLRLLSALLWLQMLRLGLADSREPTPVPTSEVHAYLPAYDSLGPYRPASSATPDLSPTAGRERAVGDEFVGSAIFHPSAFATLFQSDTLLNYLSEDGSSSAPNSLDSSYGGHPVAAGAEDTEVHGWDGVIWGDVM